MYVFSQFVAEYWCDHLKRSREEQKSEIVFLPGDPFNGLAMMRMMMMMTITKRHIEDDCDNDDVRRMRMKRRAMTTMMMTKGSHLKNKEYL